MRDAIALCTGSYSADARRALQVELVNRNAGLIASSEVSERGESAFRFAELQGREAIEMYNNYVACVNRNRNPASGGGDSPNSERDDGSVTIADCPAALRLSSGGSFYFNYNCTLLNTSQRRRSCVLTVTCMRSGRVLGSETYHVTIAAGQIRTVRGNVSCNTSSMRGIEEAEKGVVCSL